MRRPLIATAAACWALSAACWVITAGRMDGMDAGPGGDLGATGWFMATWALMMAAMMLPVVAPTAAGRLGTAGDRLPVDRVAGTATFLLAYLAVWAAAGLAVYELFALLRSAAGGPLEWGRGGRWVAVAVLAAAAGYQLTGHKRRALARCRRPGPAEPAVRSGLRAGAWCVASSGPMMAALFALGVMSIWWMALVAVSIGIERLPRDPTPGRLAGAAVFFALALGVAIAPDRVPGLTVPGSPQAMRAMHTMNDEGSMR
jgi:predicted metal-binding membrane protein